MEQKELMAAMCPEEGATTNQIARKLQVITEGYREVQGPSFLMDKPWGQLIHDRIQASWLFCQHFPNMLEVQRYCLDGKPLFLKEAVFMCEDCYSRFSTSGEDREGVIKNAYIEGVQWTDITVFDAIQTGTYNYLIKEDSVSYDTDDPEIWKIDPRVYAKAILGQGYGDGETIVFHKGYVIDELRYQSLKGNEWRLPKRDYRVARAEKFRKLIVEPLMVMNQEMLCEKGFNKKYKALVGEGTRIFPYYWSIPE